jgi:O-antigen/teichoic acid export membrane protein
LLLLAILQNTDVIILGSKMHKHSGAYAAISVPAKALVFVALVLVNYLLPEAAIRHQRGSHALRQLAHTLGVMAIPCSVLLAMSVLAAHRVLSLVFGEKLTAASPAFSTLVLAMVFMSVSVALAIYLLGIGWRWVVLILAVGAGALAAATAAAGGEYLATARADLAVQVGLCAVMVVCFVSVHRRSGRGRAEPDDASPVTPKSLA